MGRKPKGDTAMTGRERTRRWRENRTQSQNVAVQRSTDGTLIQQCFQTAMLKTDNSLRMPPESLLIYIEDIVFTAASSLPQKAKNKDLYTKTFRYSNLALNSIVRLKDLLEERSSYHRQRYIDAALLPANLAARLDVPSPMVEALDGAAESLRALVEMDEGNKSRGIHWGDIALHLANLSREAWGTVCRPPDSLEFDAPICIFVSEALKLIEIHRSPHTVSGVLRGRHGPFRLVRHTRPGKTLLFKSTT